MDKNKTNYVEKIKQMENTGNFNEQIMPVNIKYIKLLKAKKLVPTNIFFKTYSSLIRGILKLVVPAFNKIAYSTKIEGRNNLKGISRGIVISNHVLTTDNLLSRQAVKKKFYVAGGSFNNKKGLAGLTLKAGGFIPIGNTTSTQKLFNDTLSNILKKKVFVLFYPEQSLWPKYEKPRPFKRGAFYYAVKNEVPIIPVYICFRNKSNAEKSSKKTKVTVKILPPLFSNNELEEKERIEELRLRAENVYKQAYEEFYGKPLTFESINKN